MNVGRSIRFLNRLRSSNTKPWRLLTALLFTSMIAGCRDEVEELQWVVSHPRQRGSDDLYFALKKVRDAGRGDRAASALMVFTRDADPAIRSVAAGAIGSVGADWAEVLPRLLELSHDPHGSVRTIVIQVLGEVRPVDDRVVKALSTAALQEQGRAQLAAIEGLGSMGAEAAKAHPVLARLLEVPNVRGAAAKALGSIGAAAKPALPLLAEVLLSDDAEGYDRLYAAEAVYLIGGDPEKAVSALVKLLADDFLPLRCDAAVALGKMGPKASSAVPALRKALVYTPSRYRTAIGGNEEGPVPGVAPIPAAEFYPEVRRAVLEALESVSPERRKGDESAL